MNKSILLIALLLVPLSGCLGVPEGAIGPGDVVRARVTVTDADSGVVIIPGETIQFPAGQGAAGLGYEFERSIIGEPNDFVGTLTIQGDPSLQWSGKAEGQARYESPLVQTTSVASFTPSFGTPVAGETFRPQFSFFEYMVLSVTDSEVTYRPMPEQGQRDAVASVGAFLVTTVEGDTLVQVLEPDVGATFRISPPSAGNPTTPLGLAPGSYRTTGGDGEVITFDHSAASNPDLVGRNLIITVQVTQVQPTTTRPSAEPVNGNFGVRHSPYINGVPSSSVDFSAKGAGDAGHDDGHDHTH